MTATAGQTSWFLAQLKPNCAKIATDNLARQGFQTFLPMEKETRRHNGQFITRNRPLFPGYLFVALDTSMGLWRKVNSTHGITRLVSFGKEPEKVPLDLIAQLKLRCSQDDMLLPRQTFEPGESVKLIKGAFADAIVEIERVAPDRRVWVLMDLMGRKARIALTEDHLKAV